MQKNKSEWDTNVKVGDRAFFSDDGVIGIVTDVSSLHKGYSDSDLYISVSYPKGLIRSRKQHISYLRTRSNTPFDEWVNKTY